MSKEINKRLALEVMEYTPAHILWSTPDGYIDQGEWNPTENLNQAIMCIEKLRSCNGFFFMVDTETSKGFAVTLDLKPAKEGRVVIRRSESLPLAICQAILEAIASNPSSLSLQQEEEK